MTLVGRHRPTPLAFTAIVAVLLFQLSGCDGGGSNDGGDNGQPQSNMVSVSSKAAGRFGSTVARGDPPAGDEMVVGYVFSGPGTVIIDATGLIDLTDVVPAPNTLLDILPDGAGPVDRISLGLTATDYIPLEEALVDTNGTRALPVAISQVGALMGAFVPEAIVAAPGFQAIDDDIAGGGISSASLFFIGSGPTEFTATEAGTMFLGINDPYAPNNVGAFDVTLTTQ